MNVHWRLFHREGAKPARWALGAMLLAGLAAYYNSFSGAFVFDDLPSIVENASIRDLWQLRTVLAPSQGGLTTSGRPVVNLSLAINYALGELNPAGYHVTNLAIHLLAGWVLFAVLRRTFLLPALGGRFARDAAPLAAAVTLIWLVHPIQAEAVTYVIQRAESLVTLFYLLTLYGAIRLATASRAEGWCTVAAAACAAGMATKEVMVSAPLLVLLYDRAFLAGSFRRAFASRWRLYVALGATWAILAYLMSAARDRGGTAGFGIDVSWWHYARSQFGVIVHYLKLCFWPDRLCLDYAWPVATTWQEILPPALIVSVLLGACAWALVRRALWAVPAALFFLALAPTSSVVPIRDLAFEHRMYLPLAGLATVLVVGAYLLVQRLAARAAAARNARALAAVIVLAIVATLAWRTSVRNRDYRSMLALWLDTAAKAPENPRAMFSVGGAYSELAVPLYEKAGQLAQAARKTGDTQGQKTIDDLLGQASDLIALSEKYNLRAVDLAGTNVDARINLGNSYLQQSFLCRLRNDREGFVACVQKAMAQYARVRENPEAAEKYKQCRQQLGLD